MKFKNYLFDWDGSLADSLPLWFETFLRVFAGYGIETNYLEIGEKVLGDWNGPVALGVENTEEYFQKVEMELGSKLDEVRLNDGALTLVQRIKAEGSRVGILTNSKRSWVQGALERTGLSGEIDIFLGKENVTKTKPDPEMLLKAMSDLGAMGHKCVMIGDSVKDVEAAKAAGVKSILYLPKRYAEFYDMNKQRSLGADTVVESLGEIE